MMIIFGKFLRPIQYRSATPNGIPSHDTIREDDCRIRNENAALNMSWLRKFALWLLKNAKSFKKSKYQKKTVKSMGRPDVLS